MNERIKELEAELAARKSMPLAKRAVRLEACCRQQEAQLKELSKALCAAKDFIGTTQEYKTGHTGATGIVDQACAALAKAGL